jgi:hypothetical protein
MAYQLFRRLGAIVNRKFHLAAFALVLGFTLFAMQEFETIDDGLAENDDAVICIGIAAPCTKRRPESLHGSSFNLAASSFSSLPLHLAPLKAGRDLLNLLTLQKK